MCQVVLKLGWAVLRRTLQKQVAAPFWSLSLQDWWRLSLWLLISVGLSGCTHWIQSFVTIFAFIAFSNAMAPASGLPCPTCSMSFCKRYPNGVPGWDQDQASISMCSSICIFRNVKFSCRVLCLCLSIYLACIKLISWLQSGAGLAQVVWAATLFNLHAFLRVQHGSTLAWNSTTPFLAPQSLLGDSDHHRPMRRFFRHIAHCRRSFSLGLTNAYKCSHVKSLQIT